MEKPRDLTPRELDRKATVGHVLDILRTVIPEVKEAIDARLAPLRQRIEELETKAPRYRGVWKPTEEFQPGTFVTYEGSLWHANATTKGVRPGEGTFWTLAVKRGRDGKDGIK